MSSKQLAFYFDSSACSGCKACVAACKDKHGLEVGRLWRRVYEVVGGDWLSEDDAWVSNVFAYNLSVSCNHCQEPICMEVCPTKAIYKRDDGIVLINEDVCVGCGYCRWACPYNAPKLDPERGVMTKCTFCEDELVLGRDPACVSACPMRVLDYGELDELKEKYGAVRGVYPLPDESITEPALIMTPHKDACQPGSPEAVIGNKEELG
jgi:anaerobic dimethyl sulfoxide reductase subunit B (iron-sulfur subunit)